MMKFPRRERVTNFPRKLSEEYSQKLHIFFPGKIVIRTSFQEISYIFSLKILVEKVSASTKFRSWIHDFFVDQLAACPKFCWDNRRSFVVEEEPPPRRAGLHTAVCARVSWYGQRLADPQPFREAPHRRLSAGNGSALNVRYARLKKLIAIILEIGGNEARPQYLQ